MIKLYCLTVDHPVVLRIDVINAGGHRTRINRSTYSFESMKDELRLLRPCLDSVFGPRLYEVLVNEIEAWSWTNRLDVSLDDTSFVNQSPRFPLLWTNGHFELNGVEIELLKVR